MTIKLTQHDQWQLQRVSELITWLLVYPDDLDEVIDRRNVAPAVAKLKELCAII